MADRLPVYRLSSPAADLPRLIDTARSVFNIQHDFTLGDGRTGRSLRSGSRVVELAGESGGVWAADEAQLWKPWTRPDLPKEADALAKAENLVRQRALLPELAAPFRFGEPVLGGTWLAIRRDRREREERRLDVQVAWSVMVGDLPVVGGGGDFTLVLGHHGETIGFSGVWRPTKEAFDVRLIDGERADAQFRALTQGMKLASHERFLAYYAAPSFRAQEFLYPVHVYRATASFGDRQVPLRQIILPATEFGPPVEASQPQPPRERRVKPPRSAQRQQPRPARRGYATAAAAAGQARASSFEAGTSWVSSGLPQSPANAQGFVDEWAGAGWNINFNWGDANAFESDWRRDDDKWVDAADFVFYSGHAGMDGWVLASPDDGSLNFTEVGATSGSPGDLWGQQDLEWVVIAACGPLQDELLSAGGGNALARWDGAFDGLHLLMGYGAITFDTSDEGRRLAKYAKGGSTLIDAWFRTAKEIQPSTNGEPAPNGPTVYVGVMWAGREGVDPSGDHAWGFGSVSAEPTAPTFHAAMWTMC